MPRDHLAPPARIAVAVSRFNPEVTDGLLKGALTYLDREGAPVADHDIIAAPGAFELPLIAQALARTGRYDGVVCLGCVIKGETAHFEFISLGATLGLMQSGLEAGLPITFGILTTYNDEQAQARSRNDAENKGLEAARACLETIRILQTIRTTPPLAVPIEAPRSEVQKRVDKRERDPHKPALC
jgi:6,7-dimethyl-8-ribityllumazine synthase